MLAGIFAAVAAYERELCTSGPRLPGRPLGCAASTLAGRPG
jgi:hypothetical protein